MEETISIIIAEDKDLFRNLVIRELAAYNIRTIAEADNGLTLIEHLHSLAPDVVLLDLEMPVMDGSSAMQLLASSFPKTKVLILSAYYESTLAEHFMNLGAKGFVPKDAISGNIKVLADAIRTVNNKGSYVYRANRN